MAPVLHGAAFVAILAIAVHVANENHVAEGQMDDSHRSFATAAEMASLYRMALEDGEMRSHLPYRLQAQMGARPFIVESPYACAVVPCIDEITFSQRVGMWDHEAYLRSVGADTYGLCADAYHGYVARVGWLRDGAYWYKFMRMCEAVHTAYAVSFFERLPGIIKHECEMLIMEGWFVGADGRFYRHGFREEGRDFGSKCLFYPASHGYLGYAGMPEYRDPGTDHLAAYPGYYPASVRGDAEGAPEEGSPRALASRLAWLYAEALGSEDVRSRLPADVRHAISLDVPDTYRMTLIGGEWKATFCGPLAITDLRELC